VGHSWIAAAERILKMVDRNPARNPVVDRNQVGDRSAVGRSRIAAAVGILGKADRNEAAGKGKAADRNRGAGRNQAGALPRPSRVPSPLNERGTSATTRQDGLSNIGRSGRLQGAHRGKGGRSPARRRAVILLIRALRPCRL